MANDTNLSQILYDRLGSEQLLEELTKALSQEEYDDCMKYIARMHDIEIREGWDESPSEEYMNDMYNAYMREDDHRSCIWCILWWRTSAASAALKP